MAKVVSLNTSATKGVIKIPVDEVMFIEDFGIENDAHAGKWHRQVSLLANESIDKMIRKGGTGLTPGKFAENITTEGIELYTLAVGTVLKIGETIQEITQIGKECHNGCAIKAQVGDCVMPREGIFTKIIKGGLVK
ncbi:MAG: MOSC domain-containing protein, partial [Acidaminobacteraceae bacterium]